jgi:hypothetical protein
MEKGALFTLRKEGNTVSMTIIEFLNARIAEDEAAAKAVPPGPWNSMTEETGDGENIYYTVEAHGRNDYFADMADTGQQGRATADYIARFDPVRILAECAAKRGIIEAHGWQYADPYESWKDDAYRERWGDSRENRICKACGGTEIRPLIGEVGVKVAWPCAAIKHVAAAYASHRDYRAEWRP